MAFLEIRGTGTDAKDPLEIAQRYFQGVSYLTQGKALVAGLRAYLLVVKRAAQASAPYADFKKATGYRSNQRVIGSGMAKGFIYSAGYGNTLEAGAGGHYAPIRDTVSDTGSGNVWAGLGRWMQLHAPELYARWGAKARFAKVATRTGRPWVIPAAQGAEADAVEAFHTALVDVVSREVL